MAHANIMNCVWIIQGKLLWKQFWLLDLWVVGQGEIPVFFIVSLAPSTVTICVRNIALTNLPSVFRQTVSVTQSLLCHRLSVYVRICGEIDLTEENA